VAQENLPRIFVTAFAIALGVYALSYGCDSHLRQRKGPWEVDFQVATNGEPSLAIRHVRLGVSNVQVSFSGERATNAGGTVRFDKPLQPVPFGKVKFEDLTYLPGSVVIEAFGHEVEMLPRTLYVNKAERAWVNGTNLVLSAADKLPPERLAEPVRKKKRGP
jgi:hypothetical protein